MTKETEIIAENNRQLGQLRTRLNDAEYEVKAIKQAISQLTKINNGIRGAMAVRDKG